MEAPDVSALLMDIATLVLYRDYVTQAVPTVFKDMTVTMNIHIDYHCLAWHLIKIYHRIKQMEKITLLDLKHYLFVIYITLGFWGWGFQLMGFGACGVGPSGFFGLGSLYKHKRLTLGKKWSGLEWFKYALYPGSV